MKRYANETKWSSIYTSLDIQAKNDERIIFCKIPEGVSEEEIQEVIQELNSLGNFKNYFISKNEENIRGVKYV